MGRPSQAAPSPATAARLRCRSRIRHGETVNTSCGRRHARQQGPGHSSREVRAACTTAGGCARIRCAAVPGYPPTTALLQPPAPVHVTDADPGGITGPCMPRPRRAARRLEQWQGQAPLRVVIAGPPGRHQGLDAGWGAGPRQQGCRHCQVADVNRIPSAGGHSARIVELPLDVVLRERGKCRQEDRRQPSRVLTHVGPTGMLPRHGSPCRRTWHVGPYVFSKSRHVCQPMEVRRPGTTRFSNSWRSLAGPSFPFANMRQYMPAVVANAPALGAQDGAKESFAAASTAASLG